MTALNVDELLFEEKPLYTPTLEEIQEVLIKKLPDNFKDVHVEIIDCPNLKHPPYLLANSGLGGRPTLIEVGGAPFLLPLVDRTKVYDVREILKKAFVDSRSDILAVGAGAGPYMVHNVNCEGIYNINVSADGALKNETCTARVEGAKEKCVLERIPNHETRFALLMNLYACEAKPGKILRVCCKKRTGEMNYIESIRLALSEHFKDQCVGMGGLFLIRNGNVKQHVMRDFSSTPINKEEELNNWLKFYDMPAPLNAVGTFVTNEHDLDLRLQHFHSFSKKDWGGHYHIDTTPNTIEYDGFFNVAERVIRVDRPKVTHKFGRD